MSIRSRTLRSSCHVTGVGVHSGAPTSVTLMPAHDKHGIVFYQDEKCVKAHHSCVISTDFCTTLGSGDISVKTVEHLMSALDACGIDHVQIHINGQEVPVLDGSSHIFCEKIQEAGVTDLDSERAYWRVCKPVTVGDQDRYCVLEPYNGRIFSACVKMSHPLCDDLLVHTFDMLQDDYMAEIASARTYGFLSQWEYMKKAGLSKGASLDNVLVFGQDDIVNPEGMRFSNEPARHKILDAIGDLYLAGAPIIGSYQGVCAGHGLNCELLRKAFMTDALELVSSACLVA